MHYNKTITKEQIERQGGLVQWAYNFLQKELIDGRNGPMK